MADGSQRVAFITGAEGTVMIRELLTRLPDIEQAGPETWAATSLTSGRSSSPVRSSGGPEAQHVTVT